jgi:hypothetical protein
MMVSSSANRISLDGLWSFTSSDGATHELRVPGDWQSQRPELRHYAGEGVYRLAFDLPREWNGKAIILHFGAVDWYAEVSLNGKPLGSHEGGYTPFEFRIDDVGNFGGENEIVVRVVDPGPDSPVEGFDYAEIPHGKQAWYGQVSGIWQSVWIEARNLFHIRDVQVTPDVDAGLAEVRVRLSSPTPAGATVALKILDPEGNEVARAVVEPEPSSTCWKGNIAIPDAELWSPDNPSLYRVEAQALLDGAPVDAQSAIFGMRKIAVKDGLLLLNNEPIFLISALDQDFYPITHYVAPSDEYVRDQFVKAKELGLNSLRCHIKVPDPRYLDWADELGLLIWYEIPNWDTLTDHSSRRGRDVLNGMMERDWNHPSLVIISIINEEWGIKPRELAEHRAWLAEMYDYAKSFDSGRLIVDNSPCGDSIHVKTDIDDFHMYLSIPDHYREFVTWIADFASRPKWTFSQHGDATRTGHEALMLSEFGNWGLPSIGRIKDHYGGEYPWWMASNYENTGPEGAFERFTAWGLDKVFGDWDRMAEAFQEQEWRALKYQIEEMRKYPSIVGYVITEFTDLQWECNGLLDYLRQPKSFHDRISNVQAQDIIVPEWAQTSYLEGDQYELPITISHFSQVPIRGCELRWRIADLGLSGVIEDVSVEVASATRIGTISRKLPELEDSIRAFVDMRLADENGRTIARNTQEFILISEQDANVTVREYVYAPAIADALASRGARLTSNVEAAGLLITERLDGDLLRAVESGATGIVFASDEGAVQGLQGIEIKYRGESGWGGNWCNSVIWFKPELFDGLPTRSIMDFAFSEVMPWHVITGCDPERDRDDIFGGLFVGWIKDPAFIAVGLQHGKGKLLLTTLPLIEAYGRDPFGTAALNRLMVFATSPEFSPTQAVRPREGNGKSSGLASTM